MDMVQLVIWFRSTPTLELIVFNKRKDPAEAPRRIERRMERLNLPLCTACTFVQDGGRDPHAVPFLYIRCKHCASVWSVPKPGQEPIGT